MDIMGLSYGGYCKSRRAQLREYSNQVKVA
jgi:hypothetical protein